MKWYFALNQRSLERARGYWQRLVCAAVASCRKHTDYDPHLLYDGDVSDPFLAALSRADVKIIPHRVSFFDSLEHYGGVGSRYVEMASGAFLRTEIPLIESDEYVLYTDCDVIFRSNERPPLPKLFNSSPEFDRTRPDEFNTGVMVMNTRALRDDFKAFQEFIINNQGALRTFDQDAYRIFYKNRFEHLPDEWNWRPYWGINDNAKILHFHGPKPDWARVLLNPRLEAPSRELLPIFDWNPFAYEAYVPEWEEQAEAGANQFQLRADASSR